LTVRWPRHRKEIERIWRETYERTPYRELPWFSPRPYYWLRECVAKGAFRGGGRIVDIGCGAGTNSIFLARSGFKVEGVDLAPGAVESARQRAAHAGVTAHFHACDALDMPFRTASMDGAIDVGCFHTVPPPLRRAFAEELFRVLRPGGRYALSWIGAEYTGSFGPPFRPTLKDVSTTFEPGFIFLETRYQAGGRGHWPHYTALLERRKLRPPSRAPPARRSRRGASGGRSQGKPASSR
jgi:SAM-dependent methyltransferase